MVTEIKRERELAEGYNNTKYHHLKANGRKRKSRIFSLQQEEGLIEGEQNILEYMNVFFIKICLILLTKLTFTLKILTWINYQTMIGIL